MVETRNVTKPKYVAITCQNCAGQTKHDVLREQVIKEFIEGPDFSVEDTYQIVRCRGCEQVSFRHSYWSTDELDQDGDPVVRSKVYPQRVSGLEEMAGQQYLPESVRRLYRETHIALTTGEAFTLGAIGIRAIIEAVCKDKNARGTLKRKIDQLVKAGWLSQQQSVFLHKSRLLGNLAAHEMRAFGTTTLRAAWRIVENLLESVYVLPEAKKEIGKHL